MGVVVKLQEESKYQGKSLKLDCAWHIKVASVAATVYVCVCVGGEAVVGGERSER